MGEIIKHDEEQTPIKVSLDSVPVVRQSNVEISDFEEALQQCLYHMRDIVRYESYRCIYCHSVDSNITNRYIDAFPLAQQMEFNSRLLKLNDDTDILEELKGLTPEQLKVLIALAKNA